MLLRWQWDGVGDDELANVRGAQALDGGAGENTVNGASIHIAGAVLLDDAGSLEQRAGGVDLVVYDQGVAASDIANQAEALGAAVVAEATLLDDGERGIELLGEVARFLGKAGVGGDDGDIAQMSLADVADEDVGGGQLVHGDVEEALDLAGVQ